MGFIARVTKWFYASVGATKTTQVQTDQGAGYTLQSPSAAPAGVASTPLAGDLAVCLEVPGAGQSYVVAIVDPNATQDLSSGEVKIYSRSNGGAEVARIKLGNGGTISLSNADGAATINPGGACSLKNSRGGIDLQEGGNVVINGVTFDTSGNVSGIGSLDASADITTQGDVQAGPISVKLHKHGGVTSGTANTTPSIP